MLEKEVYTLLGLNHNENKAQVARQKILKYYFDYGYFHLFNNYCLMQLLG